MIHRFSSRRQPLDESFLNDRLTGARSYDRIAGYFSSSILEVAGERLENVHGTVRMVCNSQLGERDVRTARAALAAMRKEWCALEPEKYGHKSRDRFERLFEFLKSGKLRVKVLPDNVFGLIHGKAMVGNRLLLWEARTRHTTPGNSTMNSSGKMTHQKPSGGSRKSLTPCGVTRTPSLLLSS
jgi:hypothetical protein